MQSTLSQFEHYCGVNFLLINVPKSVASIHGPLPDPTPSLKLYGRVLAYVDLATYVGMTFLTTHRDIFKEHYSAKAAKARNASSSTFCLEHYIGPLPPDVALTLYRSRVDPHLVAGCEVALDVRATSVAILEDAQHIFLRRALNISRRAQLAPLFSETGLWPIGYRRYYLAVLFLIYLLDKRPTLAYAAFLEVWSLSVNDGASTWWTDLCHVGLALPVPVTLTHAQFLTTDTLREFLGAIEQSLAQHLYDTTMESRRLPLLQTRYRRVLSQPPNVSNSAPELRAICACADHLKLPRRRQRAALLLPVFSEHPLAVERLRRAPGPVPIPRNRRICRFCKLRHAIEDEAHALLQCQAGALADRRATSLDALMTAKPGLRALHSRLPPPAFLDVLLTSGSDATLPLFADFVADVFEIVDSIPPYLVATDAQLPALNHTSTCPRADLYGNAW